MSVDLDRSTFVFASSRRGATVGRVEGRLLRVMEALVERGASVHLICEPGGPLAAPAAAAGVVVALYRLDRLNFFRTRSRMRKYLLRYQPAVLHSTGLEADLLARMSARDLSVKVVNSVHLATWPPYGSTPLSRLVRRRLDAGTRGRADAFVVDREELAARLVAAGVASERVVVDHPSVDIARVASEAVPPASLPGRSAVPAVGYAGRLEHARGLDILPAVSDLLEARGRPARVMIAGEGPAVSRLVRAAAGGRVHLLGEVPSVPAVLAAFDVCCFPSSGPGTPTTLLEAAAIGRPLVATSVPGIAGLFAHDREALLVEPGDAMAFANAVASLLDDPERAARLGEAARLRTIDEYSSTAAVARHIALYRRLVGS